MHYFFIVVHNKLLVNHLWSNKCFHFDLSSLEFCIDLCIVLCWLTREQIVMFIVLDELDSHHKFNMWRITNENRAKVVHSYVHRFYTWISCIENTFDTRINVLTNEVWTYEWTNVTQISHLPMNLCVKCVCNALISMCDTYKLWMN
jgi:hypothetical protein